MDKKERNMSKNDRENKEMEDFKNTIGSRLEDHHIDKLQDPDEEKRKEDDESISPLIDPEIRDPKVPLVNDDPEQPLSPLTENNDPDDRARSGDNFDREP